MNQITMESILEKRHDVLCKEVLCYKFVLAMIMKHTLKEFKEYSIDDITNLIGNNDNEKVIGIQNAFPSHEYDVLFTTKFPKSQNEFDMLVDMEPQKLVKLGYQLHNRGIFYVGNEIAYQYGRVFDQSKYDKILPVVSIFIGMNAPSKEEENSLAHFHLTKENEIGYNGVSEEEYDKIRIIIIYLGKQPSNHPLFQFLNFIFKSNIQIEDKVRKLKDEYGIQTSESFKEEVREMNSILDYYKQQGIEQGIEKGIEKGQFEALLSAIKNVMKNTNVDETTAMKNIGIQEKDYPIYLEALKK